MVEETLFSFLTGVGSVYSEVSISMEHEYGGLDILNQRTAFEAFSSKMGEEA